MNAQQFLEHWDQGERAEKGRLIIAGLRKATCKYCGQPGQTRLCRCKPHMRLLARNHRTDVNPLVLAGPMGQLP